MIKFFRHIRQRLLTENKFSKYLLYAIGEIILVVIGILIALSINNQNQDKINRAEEKSYYKNIKRELNEDKNDLRGCINFNNVFFKQFRYATSIIENNDQSSIDSLAKIALNLLEFSDFHRQSNIYQTMVNSGEIKLLKNQKIIERLQRLEETYIYLNKLEDTHSEAVMTYAVPNIVSSIKVFNMNVENIENLYSFEFQNIFTLFTGLMIEKNEIYQRALDRIDVLQGLIDEELGIEKSRG